MKCLRIYHLISISQLLPSIEKLAVGMKYIKNLLLKQWENWEKVGKIEVRF